MAGAALGAVAERHERVGTDVTWLTASSFHQKMLEFEQYVHTNRGLIAGFRVEELVLE